MRVLGFLSCRNEGLPTNLADTKLCVVLNFSRLSVVLAKFETSPERGATGCQGHFEHSILGKTFARAPHGYIELNYYMGV